MGNVGSEEPSVMNSTKREREKDGREGDEGSELAISLIESKFDCLQYASLANDVHGGLSDVLVSRQG